MSIEAAVDMVRKGHTYRAASDKHGIPLSTLAMACKAVGVRGLNRPGPKAPLKKTTRAVTLVRQGFTFREACSRTGASLAAVHRVLHSGRRA